MIQHIPFSRTYTSQICVSQFPGNNFKKIQLCKHILIDCIGIVDDPENKRITVPITCTVCEKVFHPTFEFSP